MTDHSAAFRLNLEQQKKRAKELLAAAKAGDAAALRRIAILKPDLAHATIVLRLADAQRVIARELGLDSWGELKTHISTLDRARAALASTRAIDATMPTLHVRCGSDIRDTLLAAGLRGDFLEVSYPYCHGPVSNAPDHLEREAAFIAEFAAVSFAAALARRQQEQQQLTASITRARVVLWMENDCFDQLVLLRCLAHYARNGTPARLELVTVDRFPGNVRFIGMGQLPPEALHVLWERRRPLSTAQLTLASEVWDAVGADDPRALVALMRAGTPTLPLLAPALRRLLQELPWIRDGLGLTQRLVLQALSESSADLGRLLTLLNYQRDPLPFTTDLHLLQVLTNLRELAEPLVSETHPQWAITEIGRAVLRGERDLLSLGPRARWVGGVRVADNPWRWSEAQSEVVRGG